jgi:hypothetical protein
VYPRAQAELARVQAIAEAERAAEAKAATTVLAGRDRAVALKAQREAHLAAAAGATPPPAKKA